MKDELRINGKDAYTTWGISMDNNALSELMTPSSNKTFIENESRLEHGKRVSSPTKGRCEKPDSSD